MQSLCESLLELIYDAALSSRQALELFDELCAIRDADLCIEEILPHLRRVERMFKMLELGEYHTRQLLEQLPLAVVVADAKARIIEANTLAMDELRRGTCLSSVDGCLSLLDEESTRKLLKIVERVARSSSSNANVVEFSDNEGLPRLMIRRGFVAGVFAEDMDRDVVCVSFLARQSNLDVQQAWLTRRWQLTPAEARLAVCFTLYPNVAELAEYLHRSEHTVRSQIKAVFQKTGTHNQAELMRVLIDEGNFSQQGNLEQDRCVVNLPVGETGRYGMTEGRELVYACYGPVDGVPVFYFHSFTGCRNECAHQIDTLDRLSVRMIAPDRPGFGLSSPAPNMSFEDWPSCVARLADALDIQSFHILAMSGSSAYALACALAMPDRICSISMVSPMGEVHSTKDVRGMMPLNRRVFEIMLRSPRQMSTFLAHLMARAFTTDPDAYFRRIIPHISKADQRKLSDVSTRKCIAQTFMESRIHHRGAFAEEMLRYAQPWGLKLEQITVPVTIWHGEDSRHIPLRMVEKLAARIPNCRTHWLPDEGYYLNYSHWDEILGDMISTL